MEQLEESHCREEVCLFTKKRSIDLLLEEENESFRFVDL